MKLSLPLLAMFLILAGGPARAYEENTGPQWRHDFRNGDH